MWRYLGGLFIDSWGVDFYQVTEQKWSIRKRAWRRLECYKLLSWIPGAWSSPHVSCILASLGLRPTTSRANYGNHPWGLLVGMTPASRSPWELPDIGGKSKSLRLCLVIMHTRKRRNSKNPENDALTRPGSWQLLNLTPGWTISLLQQLIRIRGCS